MSGSTALDRLDRAARRTGIDTIAVEGARIAIFGPGPGTAGYVVLMVPDAGERAIEFRVRSMGGYALTAAAALQALVDGWNRDDDVLQWRAHGDGQALVLEGDARCRDVHLLEDDELAYLLDLVARRARNVLDDSPPSADPVADLLAGADRFLVNAVGPAAPTPVDPSAVTESRSSPAEGNGSMATVDGGRTRRSTRSMAAAGRRLRSAARRRFHRRLPSDGPNETLP